MKREVIEYIWGYTYKVEDPYVGGRCVWISIKVPKPERIWGEPCIFVIVRRLDNHVLMRFRDPQAIADVFNLQWLPKEELEKLEEACQLARDIYLCSEVCSGEKFLEDIC